MAKRQTSTPSQTTAAASAETEPEAAQPAQAPTADEALHPAMPRVYKKKKKKKKKTSRGLRDVQRAERRLSKSTDRVAKAVRKGTRTYRKRRNKSARKRRDGALTDMVINVAEGTSDALASASPILVDITKAFNTKRMRREVRRQVRAASRLVRVPFLR